ncbi:MAG: hypothetical protein N4A47_01345 [Clostridia bacterium]|jgi:hypothetical protein|nr:hypothetical protein [Clostridia bacterium]
MDVVENIAKKIDFNSMNKVGEVLAATDNLTVLIATGILATTEKFKKIIKNNRLETVKSVDENLCYNEEEIKRNRCFHLGNLEFDETVLSSFGICFIVTTIGTCSPEVSIPAAVGVLKTISSYKEETKSEIEEYFNYKDLEYAEDDKREKNSEYKEYRYRFIKDKNIDKELI